MQENNNPREGSKMVGSYVRHRQKPHCARGDRDIWKGT